MRRLLILFLTVCTLAWIVAPAHGGEMLNAYSIWPENWARPMF